MEAPQTMTKKSSRLPHQLNIWFQCSRESDHGVLSWSYPHSGPHEIREQRRDMKLSELSEDLRAPLLHLIESVARQIPPLAPIRLPHAQVTPLLTFGYFTVAVQDQKRNAELPACRLYYHEEVREIPTKVEKEIRLRRDEFTPLQLDLIRKIASRLKKMAWEDYRARFATHFHSQETA